MRIGELVSVFNSLINRTNTLVNMVQKKEILRRKAELDAYSVKDRASFPVWNAGMPAYACT